MYNLAVDSERPAIESLTAELKAVIPEDEIHGERKPSEAIAWTKQLSEKRKYMTNYSRAEFTAGKYTGMNDEKK